MRYDKENKRVRTPRVNSVVSLISSVAWVSEGNKKGYLVGSSLDSCFVATIGLSLEEFAEDVRSILDAKLKNL
jgi:hypothetical protein